MPHLDQHSGAGRTRVGILSEQVSTHHRTLCYYPALVHGLMQVTHLRLERREINLMILTFTGYLTDSLTREKQRTSMCGRASVLSGRQVKLKLHFIW